MPSRLTLADFSDHDLLFALEDTADAEGWATAEDVAIQIGIDHDKPTNCVGSRFAWCYRFGWLEKEVEKGKTKWRLSDIGYDLLHPNKLNAAAEKALSELTEGQRIAVTDLVAKALPGVSRQSAHMARRAWQHHFGGWRDKSIAPQRK